MDSFMDNHNTNHHFNQPENSRLCNSGCGFLGSEANRGFCSSCYEDYLRLQTTKSKTAFCQTPAVSESEPKINHISSQEMVSLTDAMKSCTISTKNRFDCCKKKVGLLRFGCRSMWADFLRDS
ncbi:zinc finger A20 and AN1 domain-containing stress-associated protein 12-like [Primulina tabacum]|uniref:zinc finger A20 and AN1 domain-containing stress-associated protein 12-like n=1 Tax=Primulina tabacum TaxID=48773 RepID=UPI003F596A5A